MKFHRISITLLVLLSSFLTARLDSMIDEPRTDVAEPAPYFPYGQRDVPPRQPATLRVASYNVENLFDDIDDPGLSGRNEDIDDTKSDSALAGVAAAIRAIDADVVAMQEIESETALRWFRDRYLAGLGYDHLVSIDAGDERGIEQAVLSRFPIEASTNWPREPLGKVHPPLWGDKPNHLAGEPMVYHRSPLRVTIAVPRADSAPPYCVTLFVVHQKSGRDGGYWRAAEAERTVTKVGEIRDERPEAKVVVLGDFNALRAEPGAVQYSESGLIDGFDGRVAVDDQFATHASGRVIDHLWMSPALHRDLVKGTPFIYATPSRARGADWKSPPPPGYASDHYPVVFDVSIEAIAGG